MASAQRTFLQSSSLHNEDDRPPTPPSKDAFDSNPTSYDEVESYFNPRGYSRTNSICSLSRVSFSNQLSQLTSINLPQASSLSSSISSLPTAPAAVKALSSSAVQIQQWIQKAAEVLRGLDAEDDVEWAAAGSSEGLGEVDAAIGKFEGLVRIYVTAIEELQGRPDISNVDADSLKDVVDQMVKTLAEWENVRKLLKGVKEQVELAMEWEELWGTVLGDIGIEMESLGRLVFEMEEKRHRALAVETITEGTAGLDIQELETIVEEAPTSSISMSRSNRFSLPAAFSTTSSLQSPDTPSPQDDSVLALFARMQPLRASLDFLPMRLSTFQSRAEATLPTACRELESRRKSLEKKWKRLEADAEGLRRELSEDRWVQIFRDVGRSAQVTCDSVDRSISKLQEAIDIGTHHSNPSLFAKKVENYESKKIHYGSAVQRILVIIEKGINDRLTVNGEILRLHADTRAMWLKVETQIKELDLTLEDISLNKNQQLRDSISTIVSNDRSAAGSALGTPGTSPPSSVVMGPSNGRKGDPSTPCLNGSSRRSSIMSTSSSRPSTSRRNFTMPPSSTPSSRLPRSSSAQRSVTLSAAHSNRANSPYRSSPSSATPTPTPGTRPQRPSTLSLNTRPRWNSSPKVEYYDLGRKPSNALPLPSRSPRNPNGYSYQNSRSYSSHASSQPLSSPLTREYSASPVPSSASRSHSRLTSTTSNQLVNRNRRHTSPSPARSSQGNIDVPRSRLRSHTPASKVPSGSFRRESIVPASPVRDLDSVESKPASSATLTKPTQDENPTTMPKQARPATAMAGGRRLSMLPQPTRTSGRDSVAGMRFASGGRDSVIGMRFASGGKEIGTGTRATGRESILSTSGEESQRR